MEEEYKKCIEDYEISNVGNVRRLLKNGSYTILKCSIQNKGYKYFQIKRNNKSKNYLIHQLVAEYFIGPRPENLDIDHIDRNKLNNKLENLRYVSHLENMRNTHRYVSQFPPDTEDRQQKVCKKYREEHKEELTKKKKEYYEKNKEKINNEENGKKRDIECSKCKIIRTISYSNYNHLKRNGLETNLCKRCSCINNLPNK
jgi:hypothetical protein